MNALTKSLRRPTSPQGNRSLLGDAERAADLNPPEAAAQFSQGLKPIGSTFANLAALYRAKAGE